MKKSLQTLIISLLVIITMPMAKLSAQVSVWDGTWEPWTHGTGTEADPFLIENAQQLAYLAYRVNNGLDGNPSNHNDHYLLTVDIDLNGNDSFQWPTIGSWYYEYEQQYTSHRFGGCFDGGGHTITKLYISSSSEKATGLFGCIENATIMNLSISGDMCSASSEYKIINTLYSGGIVAYSEGNSLVSYCTSNVPVNASLADPYNIRTYSGGIVGYCSGNTCVSNCSNHARVSASAGFEGGPINAYAGGIIGYGGIIDNCYNTGTVYSCTNCGYGESVNSFSGGIVGSYGIVTNCYNTGTILSNSVSSYDQSSHSYSGGIAAQSTSITNCYNIGNISFEGDNGYAGAILGNPNTVTNSYYLNTCGGDNTYGGIPRTSSEMQTESFIALLNDGSCKTFVHDVTPNVNDGYPLLTMMTNSAYTGSTSDVTDFSATLYGSVCAEHIGFSKGFEYRKEGESSYHTIVVDGEDNDYSLELVGLMPNNKYEYRAFAYFPDCDYTAYGETRTFEITWLNLDTICVYDADMLRWVAEQCNNETTFESKYIKLMNDIELPLNVANNMISIGSYPDHPFKGTFDGNGKLIYNLYIDQPNTPYQGFFGYTLNANLYNVGLVNITASGRNYTGGMVAYAENTHMRNCYVNGGTLYALSYCGGLVGYQEQGTNSIISGCYNTCTVSGNHYVGGLVGFSNYGTVRNSYVAAPVSGQGNGIGAIIGGANEVLMYNCYFSIEITGQTEAIGENNFKDGEGLTNAQMRNPQFVTTMNQGLVTPVWKADFKLQINNGFPILIWQGSGNDVEENSVIKNCISLYPNPTNDFVTIQSDDPNVSLMKAEIYDVNGRKVMSEVLDGQSKGFGISKLQKGIYNVRIQTSNGYWISLKLVVQ